MKRRHFLSATASWVAAMGFSSMAAAGTNHKLRQGAARTVFGDMPLEDCCRLAQAVGIEGLDFIGNPTDWPILRRYGLTMSMLRLDFGGGISIGRSPPGPPGWNQIGLPEAQGEFLAAFHEAIDLAAREQFPNIIVIAGTRDKVTYEEGARNAIAFLNKVKSHAEQRRVTLCMENLNSYGRMAPKLSLFDHAAWGFDVVRKVHSPRVKVLFDLWHAALMGDDVVGSLRQNIHYIGHVHTGSVPDRYELSKDSQLDYPLVAKVLKELKFQGFVTHEWAPSPGSDVESDLKASIAVMQG